MADIQTTHGLAPDTSPVIIRREDYRPPDWLVSDIALDFQLGIDATQVTATLAVTRNGAHDRPLVLDGDELVALSVSVDDDALNDWTIDAGALVLPLAGGAHRITTRVEINPAANSKLMGLFASNGMLCTQCEAEGFRRITFFPDRPDVLSCFTVRMEGDKALFPVLLANGDAVGAGNLGNGRHWAQWNDPFLKPAYLFALVAGDLVANTDSFTTQSGKHVELGIYVRDGDQDRTGHAMAALKAAMDWDERVYGREYDLAIFNIVAVSDFNMGAMENKGLNIFNSRYILADPDTATDWDYDAIEGVVAHEYFHNWSGNRVTCRDWFQLSLKEGFTVFRDQQFSADMGSAAVKRIDDVRVLRAAQFPEDSGPLAHPIRPDSYMEISNFYTATVYNKGAEVIRMIHSMAGPEAFRQGTDLYFDQHDGAAVTCEDFVLAMEAGAGLDLTQFRRWYEQAGTPQVTVALSHDAAAAAATLTLSQHIPPTPGQHDKPAMQIPLRTALFDRATGGRSVETLLLLEQPVQSFTFANIAAPPVLSINRGFSAPVTMHSGLSAADLSYLAKHDDDAFSRYEAMQQLMLGGLVAEVASGSAAPDSYAAIGDAFAAVLDDVQLDDRLRAELLSIPPEAFIGEQMLVIDPAAVHRARERLRNWLAAHLADRWLAEHDRATAVPYSLDGASRGARRMKGLALSYIMATHSDDAATRAYRQFERADNMTDRQSALAQLAGCTNDLRETALDSFYNRYAGNALVIDKWFSLQAASSHPHAMAHIRALAGHQDFTLGNPNRVRALYGGLTVNNIVFHAADGAGYAMLADMIIALDPKNPQTAAKFVPPLGRWRRYMPLLSEQMRAELERILAIPSLSKDVTEQVTKSLG